MKILPCLKSSLTGLPNDYMREAKSTTVTVTMNDILVGDPLTRKKLQKTMLFAVHLGYPNGWPTDLDLFQYLTPTAITLLSRGEAYFLFDASLEGFSPLKPSYQIFQILHSNAEKYGISPSNIIYASSNLRDSVNYQTFLSNSPQKTKLKVCALNAFEIRYNLERNAEKVLQQEREHLEQCYDGKFFASLSRLNREHRSRATFMLCQTPMAKRGLISHAKLEMAANSPSLHGFMNPLRELGYQDADAVAWAAQTPMVIDRADFDYNWAFDDDYLNIMRQIIFKIVNETQSDNNGGQELFYSEKTTRGFTSMVPLIIYGQQGCNQYLKNLGYRTYDHWFNFNFDNEPNDSLRYHLMLDSIRDACGRLENMNRAQQIDWRFSNNEVLVHNYKTMMDHKYSRGIISQLLQQMRSEQEQ